MIPETTLAGAIEKLREQKHEIGGITTNDKYEVFVEVDGETIPLNDVCRRAGLPPFPTPPEIVWEMYEGAKSRLEQDQQMLDYYEKGMIVVYWGNREVPREEQIAKGQRNVARDMDEIAMWEKMIYGQK